MPKNHVADMEPNEVRINLPENEDSYYNPLYTDMYLLPKEAIKPIEMNPQPIEIINKVTRRIIMGKTRNGDKI